MNYLPRPHRSEAAALPKGWIREEIPRSAGGISGNNRRSDVYYISPTGKRVRSKPELLKFLGDHYDLTAFDYTSGKINPLLLRTNGKSLTGTPSSSSTSIGGGKVKTSNGKPQSSQYDLSSRNTRNDATLVPPIRQTASIFKQPVTVHKAQEGGKVKVDKQSTAEKPRQLYWEKRLSGLRPSYPEDDFEAFELPKNFKPVGPGVSGDIVLASITTSLHMSSGAIQGQKNSKYPADVDPAVFMNPEQPLIAATVVSQEDIDKQESKVTETRLKLAKAIEALSG